jgi:hypothetical protein
MLEKYAETSLVRTIFFKVPCGQSALFLAAHPTVGISQPVKVRF